MVNSLISHPLFSFRLRFFLLAMLGSTLVPVWASDVPLMYQVETLAKAAPDECFFGLGNATNTYVSGGINCEACLGLGGKPKVNQAYVWGLGRSGNDLWFGTGPNVNLLVGSSYFESTNPVLGEAFAAEYGLSALAKAGVVEAGLGDWRPPDMFVFNLTNRSLARLNSTLPTNAQNLIQKTLGLRSCGVSAPTTARPGGIAILAGPSLTASTGGGINMFAFDAATRAFISSRQFPQYSNIRKWLLHEGVLYTAISLTNGNGQVLRWESNPATPEYPFAFTVVGNLDNGGSELAVHQGRLFVGTWPGIEGQPEIDPLKLITSTPGIFMSPSLPASGLTAAYASLWVKVWNIKNYETDTLCAAATGMGAMRSFGGYLYWGTMNVPGMNDFTHTAFFGAPTNSADARFQRNNTRRAISIFRGINFSGGLKPSAQVELLYGETNLPSRDLYYKTWSTNLNAMGVAPKYGKSGFGTRQNTYTWTMATFSNRLFIGTLDSSGGSSPKPEDGADLFVFENTNSAARAVTQHGFENYASYGVRTILADNSNLYLGMANPMNLMTSTNAGKPLGGWELLRLTKIFDDQEWNNLDDAWETNYFGRSGISSTNDADGDGVSNANEFIAGTNPTNRQDVLTITNVARLTSQTARLSWPGHLGRTYRVDRASALAGPWATIGTLAGSNAPAGFTVSSASNAQFFRLEARLTPVP